MKKSIFSLCVALLSIQAFSQEEHGWEEDAAQPNANFYVIQKKYQQKFAEEEKNKSVTTSSSAAGIQLMPDNSYVKFRRWEWNTHLALKPDGSFPTTAELYSAYLQHTQAKKEAQGASTVQARTVTTAAQASWVNMSRTKNSGGYWGMGLASDIGFHPNATSTFWVTTNRGGIWKTVDGGKTYTPQGDKLPFLGTGAIAVAVPDPTKSAILYLAVGSYNGHEHERSMGVYKSIDGGASWAPTGFTKALQDNVEIKSLVVSPNNATTLLMATNIGLFRTVDGGTTWTQLRDQNCHDVIFKPNSTTVYASTKNGLEKSIDNGTTFSVIVGAEKNAHRLSVSAANPSALLGRNSTGAYISFDEGKTWQKKSFPENTAPDCMTLSGTKVGTWYAGKMDMYQSLDTGKTWQKISMWTVGSASEVHADHRMLKVQPGTNTLFSMNDGGVDAYTESTKSWQWLSSNLVICEYYHAASSATNSNIMQVGSQDNGGSRRGSTGTWINTNGGDGGTQAIDPTNPNIAYTCYNPSPVIQRTIDGSRFYSLPKPDPLLNDKGASAWVLPYIISPVNSNVLYAAYHAVYKSTDQGNTWKKLGRDLTTLNDYWSALQTIAVAPSDTNHIYTSKAGVFYYTYNQGVTWTQSTQAFVGTISSICVKDNNPKTLWVTVGGFLANNKVWQSTDGGKTWTNISDGIPNFPVYSMVYQNNSEGVRYIGTEMGVYYRKTDMIKWEPYGNELPNLPVRHVHIQYNSEKLRAATFGRGIYETDLLQSGNVSTCVAPANLAIPSSDITAATAYVSWSPVKEYKTDGTIINATFEVSYKSTGTTIWSTPMTVNGTSTTLKGLTENTSYDVQVITVCSNGRFAASINFSTKSSAILAGQVYEIISALPSNRRLETNGTKVYIAADNNQNDQRWHLTDAGSGYFYIQSLFSAIPEFLTINNAVGADGLKSTVTLKNNLNTQKWGILYMGNDLYKFHPITAPSRRMEVIDANDIEDKEVQLWMNRTEVQTRQLWYFQLSSAVSTTTAPAVYQPETAAATKMEATRTFPNPATEQFTIHYQNTNQIQRLYICLTNQMGQVVYRYSPHLQKGSNNVEVMTNKLPAGMYVLTVQDEQQQLLHSQKVIIKR